MQGEYVLVLQMGYGTLGCDYQLRLFIQRLDHDLANLRPVRDLEQHRRQHLFEDSPQTAGTHLVLERHFGDLQEGCVLDLQFDAFFPERFAKLVIDRIARLDHDAHQQFLGQILKIGNDRQSSGKFGDQSEREQIVRFNARIQSIEYFLVITAVDGNETECVACCSDAFQADERSRANE